MLRENHSSITTTNNNTSLPNFSTTTAKVVLNTTTDHRFNSQSEMNFEKKPSNEITSKPPKMLTGLVHTQQQQQKLRQIAMFSCN